MTKAKSPTLGAKSQTLGAKSQTLGEELKDESPDREIPKDATPEATAKSPTLGDELLEDETEDVDAAEAASTESPTLGEEDALKTQLTELETRLAEAEQKVAEYLDGWQRAQAAFANFRKRTEAEQAHWRSTANAQLLARLLPVMDDFRRAFEAIPEELQGAPWLSGIRLIERKVNAVLESESVAAIELNPGDAFDPYLHEAVLYQEVEGFDEGEVVTEIETGYLLGDRVLRPAIVVVAKASPAPPETESEARAEETEPTAEDQ
jgi:molecular chaperone GrpE